MTRTIENDMNENKHFNRTMRFDNDFEFQLEFTEHVTLYATSLEEEVGAKIDMTYEQFDQFKRFLSC